MRKRRKKQLLLSAAAALLLTAPVYGAQNGHLYDNALLLSETEQQAAAERVSDLEEITGWEIYAVTTEDAEGKATRDYADDFYDTHAQSEDGVLLLIDMDNREVTISTVGEAIYFLNDDRIDTILDNCYSYAGNGEYYNCFSEMFDGVERCYDAGIPSGAYIYDEETGEVSKYRSVTPVEILIAIAAAAGVFAAVFFSVVGKYRLKRGTYTYDFHSFGKVTLKDREDRFVNQCVTHRKIEQPSGNSSSSGRSSTHTSSSGRSHGGGSRKF